MMMESAIYQILKQNAIQEGLREGLLQGLSESLLVILEVKFGIEGIKLYSKLREIADARQLRAIMRVIRLANSPQDVLNFVDVTNSL